MALVEAARIAYGTPPDLEAQVKLEDWLHKQCRDFRYESGQLQGRGRFAPIVVSAVFETPLEHKKLQMTVSQQVRRWKFQRTVRDTENLVPISIDSYAEGPLGEKMRFKVAGIMADIKERNRRQREDRLKDFARKLAKVHKAGVERQMRDALQKLREGAAEVEQAAKRQRQM